MKSGSDNGKSSTRSIILDSLKIRHKATVDDLAEDAGVSPMTVRHHLNSLQGEGLLETGSVRRKVGRPYHVYSLSAAGHELFPMRYVRLSNRLLDEVKRQFSPEMAAMLMRGVVQQIIDEKQESYQQLNTFEERLTFLIDLLDAEGFMASWEKQEDQGYRITEHSCPYISLGSQHDEICTFDTELMISVLQTDVTKESCMLQGDSCCQFSVAPPEQRTELPA